jgi:hypothetical protein
MKFKYLTAALTSVILSTGCFVGVANASLISYEFTGELSTITDEYNHLTNQFEIGNTFFGSFSYLTEEAEAPSTASDPTTAIYSAVLDFKVNINGYTFNGNSLESLPGYLQIWDDRVISSSVVDAFSVSSPLDYTPPITGMGDGVVVAQSTLNLFDFTHSTSILGTNIPNTVNFTSYASRSISVVQLNATTNEAFHLNGVVTSLSAVSVPEPSTLAIFALGMIGLASRRFKK